MTARATLAESGDGQVVIFRCPGCNDNHQISVGTWTFNGDLERPTFSPSVLYNAAQWGSEWPAYASRRAAHPDVPTGSTIVCHSFVTDGQIQFLSDCTHVLAGQTVDLPEWAP